MSDTGILLEHNLKTYEDAKENLEKQGCTVIVQPTGTGKSYLMMQFMHEYKDKWKIIVAPNKFFLERLQKNKYWVTEKTFACTYTWLTNNIDKLEEKLISFGVDISDIGFIAFDEIHRAGAVKWNEAFNKLKNLNKSAKVLGLTATPVRYNDKVDVINSMFGGSYVYNLTFEDAVAKGILPQLNYIIGMLHISTDLDYLTKLSNENKAYKILDKYIEEIKNSWNFGNYFVGLMDKYLDKNGDTHKHIVFTRSIADADKMEPELLDYFSRVYKDKTVKIYKMHCGLSYNINRKTIEEFQNSENEISIALVVNMMNESFHIDGIESIILLRGTNSPTSYIQSIGRALNVNGKAPLIFDFVDNIYNVGEIFKRFKISKKHSKVERINLDDENWFSSRDSSYHKHMRSKTKHYLVDKSVDRGIFKEVIDEAADIEDKINYVLALCNHIRPETMQLFKEYIDETECKTIFGIKDRDKFEWCKWVLENKQSKGLSKAESEIYAENINLTAMSEYILFYAGKNWHKTYVDIIRGTVSEKQKKLFTEYTIEGFLRNMVKPVVVEKLQEHEVYIDISNNEGKLKELYDRYKNDIKDIVKIRIGWLNEENIRRNPLIYYKVITSVENKLTSVKSTSKIIPIEELSDVIAYKYLMCLKNKYDKFIDDNEITVESMDNFKELRITDNWLKHEGKSEDFINSLDELKEYNDFFMSKSSFDELPPNVRELLEFRGYCTIERIKNRIMKSCDLFEYSNRIRDKINYYMINSDLKRLNLDEVKSILELINDRYGDYEWCPELTNEIKSINHLVNLVDGYLNNTSTSEDRKYIDEYIEKLKYREKISKIKNQFTDGFAIENETQTSIVRRLNNIEYFKSFSDYINYNDIIKKTESLKQVYKIEDCYDVDIYNTLINSISFLDKLTKSNYFKTDEAVMPKDIKKVIGFVIYQYEVVLNYSELVMYSEYRLINDYINKLDGSDVVYLAEGTLASQDRKCLFKTFDKLQIDSFLSYKEKERLKKLIDKNCTKTFNLFIEYEQLCNKHHILLLLKSLANEL